MRRAMILLAVGLLMGLGAMLALTREANSGNNDPGQGFIVQGKIVQADAKTPAPNVTVKLQSQPLGKGEVMVSLKTDAQGNFSSPDPVDLSKGAYPLVQTEKAVKYMSKAIPKIKGNCMSCHGKSVKDIFAE
jgi:hypothetical protein